MFSGGTISLAPLLGREAVIRFVKLFLCFLKVLKCLNKSYDLVGLGCYILFSMIHISGMKVIESFYLGVFNP